MFILFPIIIALLIAIMLSAVYSGAETAAITVNEAKLRERADQGHDRAIRTLRLLEDQRRVLAIVLVGTNLANVMAALLCERAFISVGRHFDLPDLWFTIINFLFITPLLLIFGEIVPKHFCRIKANAVLPRLVGFLKLSGIVFLPILNFCTFFTGLLLRPFGIRMSRTAFRRRLSVEDIKAMIGRSSENGDIEQDEHVMIARIFDLRDSIVREIMRPLVDLVALKLSEVTLDDIRAKARETGYSRFPVFEHRSFHLNGYIDIYDVIRSDDTSKDVRDFIRKPFYVPETLTIGDLLEAFLKNREPAAIVIDEHGGTVGWVTREDVLEEVVGEIQDEFDLAEPKDILIVDERTLLVSAHLDLDDMNRQFEADLPLDEDFDTIGGLVFTRLGRVPELGETIVENSVEITVEGVEGLKITKLRVRFLDPEELSDDTENQTLESSEDSSTTSEPEPSGMEKEAENRDAGSSWKDSRSDSPQPKPDTPKRSQRSIRRDRRARNRSRRRHR